MTESEQRTQWHQFAAVKPIVCRKINGTQDWEDQKMATLKKGDSAPDFNLIDQEGKKVKLADFKGKKVLLYFYPKANTSG
jgi:cytochrome oxidase Cu insertion factor (SCO1/SenC/PrrC family)